MAERLARAGWTLQVHDVDTGAAERLVGLGDVEVQPSARAVAERADVVVLMLPNSDAVEAVLVEAGALDALRRARWSSTWDRRNRCAPDDSPARPSATGSP